jgi:hypothetical protein
MLKSLVFKQHFSLPENVAGLKKKEGRTMDRNETKLGLKN